MSVGFLWSHQDESIFLQVRWRKELLDTQRWHQVPIKLNDVIIQNKFSKFHEIKYQVCDYSSERQTLLTTCRWHCYRNIWVCNSWEMLVQMSAKSLQLIELRVGIWWNHQLDQIKFHNHIFCASSFLTLGGFEARLWKKKKKKKMKDND